MKKHIGTIAGSAAALLLAVAPAATQDEVGRQAVTDFFATMQENVSDAVEAEDFEALLQWTQDHVAEEAVIGATNEVMMGGERKSFTVVSLTKADLLRMGRMTTGMLAGMPGDALRDYSLEVSVGDVSPIGPDAATVAVEYTERVELAVSGKTAAAEAVGTDEMQTAATGSDGEAAAGDDPASEAGADPDGAGETLQVTANARCMHLVRRSEGGDMMIGLSTCEARTTF